MKLGSVLAGLGLLLVTLLSGAYAQEPTGIPSPTVSPTPMDALFQEVVVDQHRFTVDSFYPCQSFVTARVSKLGSDESESAVVTTITIQMFIRSGDQMIPIDAFSTYESEVTASVPVGGTFACKPPIPSESGESTRVDPVSLPGVQP